jgi:CRISPR-associated protein Csd1
MNKKLIEFYDRKYGSDNTECFFSNVKINYVIVIDNDGKFIAIEELDKKEFLVPLRSGRSSDIKANLLYDNIKYSLNIIDKKDDGRCPHFDAFISKIKEVKEPDDEITATLLFLENNLDTIKTDPLYNKLKSKQGNMIAFRLLNSEHLTCQSEAVKREVINTKPTDYIEGICSISGKHDFIPAVHQSVRGTIKFISFNTTAQEHYKKTQSYNSQVGFLSMLKSTTALRYLLGKKTTSFNVGKKDTYVFWENRKTATSELCMLLFNGQYTTDNGLLKAAYSDFLNGVRPTILGNEDANFYILGLRKRGPGAGGYYDTITFYEEKCSVVSNNIMNYFSDLQLEVGHHNPVTFTDIAATGFRADLTWKEREVKFKPIIDLLFKTAMHGTRFPVQLLQNIFTRLEVETRSCISTDGHFFDSARNINRLRFMVAYINRSIRLTQSNEALMKMTLDTENMSTPYLLGRLFAILERIANEYKVKQNIIKWLGEKQFFAVNFSQCMTKPQAMVNLRENVFRIYLNGLDKGKQIWLNTLIGEVEGKLVEIPKKFSLDEKVKFTLGHAHQQSYFFKKKEQDAN